MSYFQTEWPSPPSLVYFQSKVRSIFSPIFSPLCVSIYSNFNTIYFQSTMRCVIYMVLNASIFRWIASIFSPLCVIFRVFLEQQPFIFSLFAVLFLEEASFLGAISRFRFGLLAIERKHLPLLLDVSAWIRDIYFI